MLHGRIVRPASYGATIVSVDDSKARGMAGVTVVRDGEFLAVVAPTERAAGRAASAVQAQWSGPKPQPTSETIYEHLKKTPTAEGGGRGCRPIMGDVAVRSRAYVRGEFGFICRSSRAAPAASGPMAD